MSAYDARRRDYAIFQALRDAYVIYTSVWWGMGGVGPRHRVIEADHRNLNQRLSKAC